MTPIDHQFYAELGRTPRLTHEENAALGRRIRAGDRAAIRLLVAGNLRLIPRLAARRLRPGAEIGDLIAEGALGLMRAAESYDPEVGKFSTYAHHWIDQKIRRYLKSYLVHVPEYLATDRGRDLKPKYSAFAVTALLDWANPDDESDPIADYPDHRRGPDHDPDDCDAHETLNAALDRLPEGLRIPLVYYFGLGGSERLTFAEVGARMGYSRSNAGWTIRKGIEALRVALGMPPVNDFRTVRRRRVAS